MTDGDVKTTILQQTITPPTPPPTTTLRNGEHATSLSITLRNGEDATSQNADRNAATPQTPPPPPANLLEATYSFLITEEDACRQIIHSEHAQGMTSMAKKLARNIAAADQMLYITPTLRSFYCSLVKQDNVYVEVQDAEGNTRNGVGSVYRAKEGKRKLEVEYRFLDGQPLREPLLAFAPAHRNHVVTTIRHATADELSAATQPSSAPKARTTKRGCDSAGTGAASTGPTGASDTRKHRFNTRKHADKDKADGDGPGIHEDCGAKPQILAANAPSESESAHRLHSRAAGDDDRSNRNRAQMGCHNNLQTELQRDCRPELDGHLHHISPRSEGRRIDHTRVPTNDEEERGGARRQRTMPRNDITHCADPQSTERASTPDAPASRMDGSRPSRGHPEDTKIGPALPNTWNNHDYLPDPQNHAVEGLLWRDTCTPSLGLDGDQGILRCERRSLDLQPTLRPSGVAESPASTDNAPLHSPRSTADTLSTGNRNGDLTTTIRAPAIDDFDPLPGVREGGEGRSGEDAAHHRAPFGPTLTPSRYSHNPYLPLQPTYTEQQLSERIIYDTRRDESERTAQSEAHFAHLIAHLRALTCTKFSSKPIGLAPAIGHEESSPSEWHIRNVLHVIDSELMTLPMSAPVLSELRLSDEEVNDPASYRRVRHTPLVECNLPSSAVASMTAFGHCEEVEPSEHLFGGTRLFPTKELRDVWRLRVIKHTKSVNDVLPGHASLPTPLLIEKYIAKHRPTFALLMDKKAWFDQLRLDRRVRRFFAFRCKSKTYQLCTLPMGLTTSVRSAQAKTTAICDVPCPSGVVVFVYVDNIIVLGKTKDDIVQTALSIARRARRVRATIKELESVTFTHMRRMYDGSINDASLLTDDEFISATREGMDLYSFLLDRYDTSEWDNDIVTLLHSLIQSECDILGRHYDLTNHTVGLTQKTQGKLRNLTKELQRPMDQVSVHEMRSWIGLLAYTQGILHNPIPFPNLFRTLNMALRQLHFLQLKESDVVRSPDALADLRNWTTQALAHPPRSLSAPPTVHAILIADACKTGWAALLIRGGLIKSVARTWTHIPDYITANSSVAEPLGILQACTALLRNEKHVWIVTDNTATMEAINSPPRVPRNFLHLAVNLMRDQFPRCSFSAFHVPGHLMPCDEPSRGEELSLPKLHHLLSTNPIFTNCFTSQSPARDTLP